MIFPTLEQAKEIFEEIFTLRNASPYPLSSEQEQTLRLHSQLVALNAQKIASSTVYLNSDKAYIMGLLHDCGRLKDERAENTFHGLVGYEFMMSKGYPELAKISLSHCFYEKDFDISTYPQSHSHLLKSKQILSILEYDDYDRLLQLCDILNDMGNPCSIEYLFKSIAQRYNVPLSKLEPMIELLKCHKYYFDEKCGQDIYQMLGIKNI